MRFCLSGGAYANDGIPSHPIPPRSVRLFSLALSVDCVVMHAFKGRDLVCSLSAIKEATKVLKLQTDRMSCTAVFPCIILSFEYIQDCVNTFESTPEGKIMQRNPAVEEIL